MSNKTSEKYTPKVGDQILNGWTITTIWEWDTYWDVTIAKDDITDGSFRIIKT